MRIVEIDDKYIDYLRKSFPKNILDNKYETRIHKRKFVGIVLEINSFIYFAPLSSPKKSDYDTNNKIKKSTNAICRIVVKNKLLGKILLNNMFPVPKSKIIPYNVDNEKDISYKILVLKQIRWIQKNTTKIKKKANIIYKVKQNETFISNNKNKKFLESISPFNLLETKCLEYNKSELLNKKQEQVILN